MWPWGEEESPSNGVFSFDKQKSQQKHDKHDGTAQLIPKFFLPEDEPDKMYGGVQDDEMVQDLYHDIILYEFIQDRR